MIASVPGQRRRDECFQTTDVSWHPQFLEMLPRIERHARIVFRHLNPGDREERIQNVIAQAVVAYARLVEQGWSASASWSSSRARDPPPRRLQRDEYRAERRIAAGVAWPAQAACGGARAQGTCDSRA